MLSVADRSMNQMIKKAGTSYRQKKVVQIYGPVRTRIVEITKSSLNAKSKRQLLELATELGLNVFGRWQPTKAELITEIWDQADKCQPRS